MKETIRYFHDDRWHKIIASVTQRNKTWRFRIKGPIRADVAMAICKTLYSVYGPLPINIVIKG